MKVKICGIRSIEEAKKVHEFQPDAIGILVGFKQDIAPNVISEDNAREIVETVSKSHYVLDTYLLTTEEDTKTNYLYSSSIGNSHIQLLGDISTDEISKLKRKLPKLGIVKVIHVTGHDAITLARKYDACLSVDALLLDSRIRDNKRGGTGIPHNWKISSEIAKNSNKPVWLAGGLTTSNLRKAIETVRPYGVDVETGVQNPDGSKNYTEIKKFIEIAHRLS